MLLNESEKAIKYLLPLCYELPGDSDRECMDEVKGDSVTQRLRQTGKSQRHIKQEGEDSSKDPEDGVALRPLRVCHWRLSKPRCVFATAGRQEALSLGWMTWQEWDWPDGWGGSWSAHCCSEFIKHTLIVIKKMSMLW